MLAAWGRIVCRFRWTVVVLSMVPLVPALWLVIGGGNLDTSVVPISTESGQAAELVARELPRPASFDLIFSDPRRPATDPSFRDEVARALDPLRRDPRVTRIRTAYDVSPPDPWLLSRDGRRTRAIVELAQAASPFESLEFSAVPPAVYRSLRGAVRSDALEIVAAGTPALHSDFTLMAEKDLRRAEAVTLPLVVILLLLVFGSVVAAGLPVLVAILSMTAGMAAIVLLSRITAVSIYATNLITMVGLGVAIDYALFIVTRFREEMHRSPVPDAVSRTMATAGRAILFSGLTVAIGFVGMLLVPIGSLTSLGLAGTLVVSLAVLYSITFLPALLAILGPRVDALRVPLASRAAVAPENGESAWHRVASFVMDRPWTVLLPVVAVLILVGLPFRAIRLGTAGTSTLPADAESRRGEERLREGFQGGGDEPILAVLHRPDGSPAGGERIGRMYDLAAWLAKLPNVTRIDSIVTLDPRLAREDYVHLASLPAGARPPPIDAAFRQMVGPHVAVLAVHTGVAPDSDAARALVRTIRGSHPAVDGRLLVSGRAAFDIDFIGAIARSAPKAIAFIVLVTCVVLFLLLGSVVLPAKAVVMNLLSITASYGALVWIFQEGHLARWLGFTPGPIESAIPLIMFCVLFGLSMDYEVLLLSRTREEYERSGDNRHAVAVSLERTGRLITGAAAIMAVVFFGFGLAHAVMIKAIGIGMGLAVAVDATIVRILLVPATMRLLDEWNWWAPSPLAGLHRRLSTRWSSGRD